MAWYSAAQCHGRHAHGEGRANGHGTRTRYGDTGPLSLWERARVRGPVSAKTCVPAALLARCRELRQNATDAERLLWHLLRNRHLAGAKFRRQHPVGSYILDFYCAQVKLAIELDGGQHSEAAQQQRDRRRTRMLAAHGIRVLRFWNNEVLAETEAVLETIWNALTPTLSQGERE